MEGEGIGKRSSEKVTLEICQNLKMSGRGKEGRRWGKAFQAFLTRSFLSSKFLLYILAKPCLVHINSADR